MTDFDELPDILACIPLADDKTLIKQLNKLRKRLERVLHSVSSHPISELAIENEKWARGFVLAVQFVMWDACNVAKAILLLGKHDLGLQALSLARGSLESVTDVHWLAQDPKARMKDFFDYRIHFSKRCIDAMEEAGGQLWATFQVENAEMIAKVEASWKKLKDVNPKIKPRAGWSKTNTTDRGKQTNLIARHEYIYLSQATHITPIIVEKCFEEQPVKVPPDLLSMSYQYQVFQLKRSLHLAGRCFSERTGFKSPEQLKKYLDKV